MESGKTTYLNGRVDTDSLAEDCHAVERFPRSELCC
jgi:hypothetical protein